MQDMQEGAYPTKRRRVLLASLQSTILLDEVRNVLLDSTLNMEVYGVDKYFLLL